jgi:hypothetical protein
MYMLSVIFIKYKFSVQLSGHLKTLPDRKKPENILEFSEKDAHGFTYFGTCDKNKNYYLLYYTLTGWDSSVGIANGYGLDGPGIESLWGGGIFRTRPDRPWGPPSLLYNGYRVFSGGKAAGAWC